MVAAMDTTTTDQKNKGTGRISKAKKAKLKVLEIKKLSV
jgi:hypothetical protein